MNSREVVELLKRCPFTLGAAESLTGGLFASIITSHSGVSKFFKGSIVSYWNEVKENVLSVSSETIAKYGVVSYQTAEEMARGVEEKLHTDICVSFTGNAGPTNMEDKPKGLIYIGILFKGEVQVHTLLLTGSRNSIRKQCVSFAFDQIRIILEKYLSKNPNV